MQQGPRVDTDVDPEELVNGVNKRYLQVERVLSKAESKKGATSFAATATIAQGDCCSRNAVL